MGKCGKKLMKLFTFTIYIRIVLEAMLILSLTSIAEIYDFNISSIQSIVSMIIAVGIVSLLLSFIAINVIMWHKSQRMLFELGDSYFKELLEGTKETKSARLFVLIFVIRRLTSVTWVVTSQSLPKYPRIIVFTIIQLFAVSYSIILRPLQLKKENIIEIIQDVGYLLI